MSAYLACMLIKSCIFHAQESGAPLLLRLALVLALSKLLFKWRD